MKCSNSITYPLVTTDGMREIYTQLNWQMEYLKYSIFTCGFTPYLSMTIVQSSNTAVAILP